MKLYRKLLYTALILSVTLISVSAQVDSGIKIISPAIDKNYIQDMSGDGRFAVIESDGNIATYNPRNADRNREIFLLDYAQRHIFQLTNTKNALNDPSGSPTQNSNIRVKIVNLFPQISNDGRWISFNSNAATSIVGNTNPGSFDGNAQGVSAQLQQDGNTEIWMYQLPAYQAVNLSSGSVPPFVDLGGGGFIRVTNTPPSSLPSSGTSTQSPFIATDNREASIDDNGTTLSFTSNRDLVTGGNAPPSPNDEIFVYKRAGQSGIISQITVTTRGTGFFPITNYISSIAGNGQRVVFLSNAETPVPGMSGCNPDFGSEVFFTDLNSSSGAADGIMRQVTFTPQPSPGDVITLFQDSRSKPVSRDGRYILLHTRARLTNQGDDGLESGYADFLYDSQVAPSMTTCQENAAQFTQITPRSNADPSVPAGYDEDRFPRFTDYDALLSPGTIVFGARTNLRPDGSVSNSTDGLNPSPARPAQVYAYSISRTAPIYKRLTNSPVIDWGRVIIVNTTNKIDRMTMTIGDGTGSVFAGPNRAEIYYLKTPNVVQEEFNVQLNFKTGAGGLAINDAPPAAQGLMPNMLGSVSYTSQQSPGSTGFATNVSNSRKFVAPLDLAGVSIAIDGIATTLLGVTNGQINFIVPPEVAPGNKSFVINHNGVVLRGTIPVIAVPRPDIVTDLTATNPGPGGRARLLNVTDPNNLTPEPFSVTTQTSNGTLPTRLRLFLTGVQSVTADAVSIQIRNVTIPSSGVLTNATATDYPGVFSFDFILPQSLAAAGNVPIIVSVNSGGQTIQSRITNPPQLQINVNQLPPDDIAVWRPGSGGSASSWYILNSQQQLVSYQFGTGTDTPITRDFDGDGKVDFCVYRASAGQWYIVRSSDGVFYSVTFGAAGDLPAAADYDGDGKADVAVWRPSDGGWYIINSSTNTNSSQYYGAAGDQPEPADYDGDGKADIAVWRKTTGSFYAVRSSDNGQFGAAVGASGDLPAIGDYDGDGKADFAVYRPSNGVWYILNSTTALLSNFQWGGGEDIPVQGNYSDGDSKTDIAVWRPSEGVWYIHKSTDGGTRAVQWGQRGDTPVPAPYRR